MNSKLFSQFDPKDVKENRFGEDLSLLLCQSEDHIELLVDQMQSLAEARTTAEKKPILEDLESKTGLPRTSVDRVLVQLRFFLSALYHDDTKSEDPSLWAKDLIELDLLAQESESRFLKAIAFLKANLDTLAKIYKEGKSETGVLPVFRGADTTFELRGVLKDRYKWGTDVEQFEAEILSMRPIVSVAISVDSGVNKVFTFQATPDELDYLISELRAAQKCATALAEKLSK